MKLTKKYINKDLEQIYKIYVGNIPDRYVGLSENECKTDIQKTFWNVINDSDFEYKNKKEQFNEIYKRMGLQVGESKTFEKTLGGVIIRNLPANEKYNFIGSGSFAYDEYWLCENCGRLIKNWNSVKDSKSNSYLIGSECINTVLKYDATSDWNIKQKISTINKSRRILKKAVLNNWSHIVDGQVVVFKNSKGLNMGYIYAEDYFNLNKRGVKK